MTGSVRRVIGAALVVALVATGCGREHAVVKPASVPAGLVPPRVQHDAFAFYESELPQVKDAFTNGGASSLVADGRLWELRTGDRLVGLLQMSTLVPEVHLTNRKHRDQVINQIMPVGRDQITVGDIPVFTSLAKQKSVFLWFATNMFFVLTLKPGSEDHLDAEGVLGEVIAFALQSNRWKPLYFEDETTL